MKRNGEIKPTLIFVHGAWHGAWTWKPLIERLEAMGYPCKAFDFTGHGDRPRDAWFSLRGIGSYIKDLEAVAVEHPEAVLIGHSMGGLVIQRYLRKHKVRGAVLMAPVPHNAIPLSRIMRVILDLRLRAFSMLFGLHDIGEPGISRLFFYDSETDEALVSANAASICSESPRLIWRNSLAGKFHLRPYRPAAPLPMLVLAGGRDYFFSPARMKRVADQYKGDFVLFKDLPHNIMDGRGTMRVAAVVDNWWRSFGSAG